MAKDNKFSDRALNQIQLWVWCASVLPITALAGVCFAWSFGTANLINIVLTASVTAMIGAAAVWWWWIIWTVSRILKKDRKVADELAAAAKELTTIKSLVKATFTNSDK